MNFNKKNTGVAALKVLKKNGVEVQEAYPGCCGMPFLEQADLPKVVDQAKKISKDLIEWINKGYKVVTLTASCGLMLKFEWPLLLPENEQTKSPTNHFSTEHTSSIFAKDAENNYDMCIPLAFSFFWFIKCQGVSAKKC